MAGKASNQMLILVGLNVLTKVWSSVVFLAFITLFGENSVMRKATLMEGLLIGKFKPAVVKLCSTSEYIADIVLQQGAIFMTLKSEWWIAL